MTITPIGFIIIPLSLVIFLVWPRLLVPWAIVASVFEAASVINFGSGVTSIGIAPFYFVVMLIGLRFAPQYLSGRLGFAHDDPLLNLFRLLTLFTCWGVVSVFVLPFLFENVVVNTPHGGMDTVPLPLHWSLSNAAQGGYLVLDWIFILYATWHARDHRDVEADVRAFRSAGLIVVAVGLYQLVAHTTGLPFPKEFFNSNESWKQLIDQRMAGTWRLSATFTEPSAAGSFFATWSAYFLFTFEDRTVARRFDWLLLCSGIAMLLLTTSSTGYFVTGVMLSMFVMQQVLRLIVQGRMNPRVLMICVVIGVGGIAAVALLPNFNRLLQQVLFQKSVSISARQRTATQWQALVLTGQSFGLGVGLGSNRPSGMLFYILSDLGVPGLLLFVGCLYMTFSMVSASIHKRLRCGTARGYLKGSAWAFGVTLFAMVVSGAEVTSPRIWVTWALISGILNHAAASSRQQAITRAPSACVEGPFGMVETARFG
jgi:hypothetical protein